jgi:predicted nucleic acid-binding protein
MTAIGKGPVALDTAIFIYYMEERQPYVTMLDPLFEALDSGRLVAVASEVSLLEVLVVPLKAGDLELADRYEALLSHSRGLSLVGVSRPLLRKAAALRGSLGLQTPDAILLATALSCGCTALVTNDRDFGRVTNLAVVNLDNCR